jgi:branched-chain amino acid transport system ATP-binding protein
LTAVPEKKELLAVRDLDAGYGDAQVLWGVSLVIAQGEIVGLLGGNGAGKTTLLNIISGLNSPRAGSIHYLGEEITHANTYNRVRNGITQIPEGRQLFPGLTVRQNLLLGAFSLADKSRVSEELDIVFDLFPILSQRQKQLAGTLSGGEQQMAALGRGLMSSPKLILVDELSLGLAPVMVERIVEALKKVYREKSLSILVVEQDVHLCLELSTTAYVLETGRIVRQGPSEELARDPQIRKSYLGI